MTQDLAIDGGTPQRTAPFPTISDGSGHRIGTEEEEAVVRVLRTGKLNSTVGTETRALETDFADYLGVPEAVASSSGTAALHLAVAAVNPEPGDEFITTGLSDAGTVLPVLAQNAVPVFVDVDPATGMLDVGAVEAAITDRTRAIIVVHLFGQPAPVLELRALADRAGIILIEDCAQAYLTRVGDGRMAGTVGHLGCFSLQQSKHITAGDGGLTVASDPALARRARLFTDKAWPRDTDERTHLFLGLNYRMSELQAAVARVQLTRLEGVVADRRRNAAVLTQALRPLAGIATADPETSSYWLFPLFLDIEAAGGDAHWYARALQAEGIPASGGYLQRPLYLNPVFTSRRTYGESGYPLTLTPEDRAQVYAPGLCPVTEELIDRRLVVVQWNENYTDADVADIAAAIAKVHNRATG